MIPDLPPDITFRPMRPIAEDEVLAFEAKRAAMGPHIEVRWGWDEKLQAQIHRTHYAAKPFHEIRMDLKPIGTLSFQVQRDHARFGEFYILPAYQRRGIGSAILQHILRLADSLGLPVRLEYLQWNPVGSLYRRHGFNEMSRNEIHVFMERAVQSKAPGTNQ